MSRLRSHRSPSGDEGSALIEFTFLAVLMLVPIVYLIIVLGRLQAGALAAEQAAREGGRAFVTAPVPTDALPRAQAAAALSYRDQGFAVPARSGLTIVCSATPCLTPDARVSVRSTLVVSFPGVPRLLSRVIPVSITVSATHVATVDRFAGR